MRVIINVLLVWSSLPKNIFGLDKYSMIPTPPESAPVIRAVLIRCPKLLNEGNHVAKNIQNERHIMMSIRVNPSFHVEQLDKFVVIDKIFDTAKRSKAKIMSSYLIQISRGEPVIMYPLELFKFGQHKKALQSTSLRSKRNGNEFKILVEQGQRLKGNYDSFQKRYDAIRHGNGNQCLSSSNKFDKEFGKITSKYFKRKDTGHICNGLKSQGMFKGCSYSPKEFELSFDIHTNHPSIEGIEYIHESKKNLNAKIGDETQTKFKRGKNFILSSYIILKHVNARSADPLKSDDSCRNYREYYSNASLQSTISHKFQNQQSQKYLPKGHKFDLGFEHPGLDFCDNHKIIEVASLSNEETVPELKNFRREMQNPLLVKLKPLPVQSFSDSVDAENCKRKRSFGFCDTATLLNTEYYNDYNLESIESKSRNVDNDITPCSSCGGKYKQTQGKKNNNMMPTNNECKCGYSQKECVCSEKKTPRSICDTSYTVFNMNAPLPFLMTKLRIYRKRKNTWYKIAPSITLNSLSGIFANANLSIFFTSHVNIIQLEKSLRLQSHQLLIPKDYAFLFARELSDAFVKNRKLLNYSCSNNSGHILNQQLRPDHVFTKCSTNDKQNSNLDLHQSLSLNAHKKSIKKRRLCNKGCVQTINMDDFPATTRILNRCPKNPNRLCFNMLDDKVPEYIIKVRMPFQENDIIHENVFKVKIARIVTDASTKDILKISVEVVNQSSVAQKFSVLLRNYEIASAAAKSNVLTSLQPHISETITFLLPFLMDTSHKRIQFSCDVVAQVSEVKMNTNWTKERRSITLQSGNNFHFQNFEETTTIASRVFVVEMESRCFCVWKCKCHCTAKLETHLKLHICQTMDLDEEKKSGMLLGFSCNGNLLNDSCGTAPFSESEDGFYFFIKNASVLLLLMFLLGLFKAFSGGLCSATIDRYGFDHAYLGEGYDDSSRCRRFLINAFFFIVYPFFFLCKCFTSPDLDILADSAEWPCENGYCTPVLLLENKLHYKHEQLFPNKLKEDQHVLLYQHIDRGPKPSSDCGNCNNYRTRMSAGKSLRGPENHLNITRNAICESLWDENQISEVDEEDNTIYVLKTLTDSRESMIKLLRPSSFKVFNIGEQVKQKLCQAAELVETLKNARIVYRILNHPIGNVRSIPYGITYCVQGYFLLSLEGTYEFVNYHPLVQYYGMSTDEAVIEVLRPPVLLCPEEFSRIYNNSLEVFCAEDLRTYPPSNIPCINVASIDDASTSLMNVAFNTECSRDAVAVSNIQPFDNSRALVSEIL